MYSTSIKNDFEFIGIYFLLKPVTYITQLFLLFIFLTWYYFWDSSNYDLDLISNISTFNTLFTFICLKYIYRFPFQSFAILFLVAFSAFHLAPMLLVTILDEKIAFAGFSAIYHSSIALAALIYNIAINSYFLGTTSFKSKNNLDRFVEKKNKIVSIYLRILAICMLSLAFMIVFYGNSKVEFKYLFLWQV